MKLSNAGIADLISLIVQEPTAAITAVMTMVPPSRRILKSSFNCWILVTELSSVLVISLASRLPRPGPTRLRIHRTIPPEVGKSRQDRFGEELCCFATNAAIASSASEDWSRTDGSIFSLREARPSNGLYASAAGRHDLKPPVGSSQGSQLRRRKTRLCCFHTEPDGSCRPRTAPNRRGSTHLLFTMRWSTSELTADSAKVIATRRPARWRLRS